MEIVYIILTHDFYVILHLQFIVYAPSWNIILKRKEIWRDNAEVKWARQHVYYIHIDIYSFISIIFIDIIDITYVQIYKERDICTHLNILYTFIFNLCIHVEYII